MILFRKLTTVFRILPNLQFGVLLKLLPNYCVIPVQLLIRFLLKVTPLKLFKLLPCSLTVLILTSSLWLDIKKLSKLRVQDLRVNRKNQESIENHFKTLEYLEYGVIPFNFDSIEVEEIFSRKKDIKLFWRWAIWNLSHLDFERANLSFIRSMERSSIGGNSMIDIRSRYLRDYTSNLGHLALLFLYLRQFQDCQIERTIYLSSSTPANRFFLELIKKESPIKIVEVQEEKFMDLDFIEIDTFQYSLDCQGSFRVEPEGVSFPKSKFKHYERNGRLSLKLDNYENKIGEKVASEFLGNDCEWYAVLHVREPVNGRIDFSQSRDANVSTYYSLAQLVQTLGGKLVRMGDLRFPKLDSSFPAFDYAHSPLRSEFMDIWLWANCKFWVGNINGAAFPPICFDKPRLLTNQWHWYLHGPECDFVLRKNLVSELDENIVIHPKEVLSSRLSKIQDRGWLKRMGYKVSENTEEELEEALEIFYNFNFGDGSLYAKKRKTEEILYIESILGNQGDDSMMKLLN
jgi:putative glycosyltransferase (TIGR04372 family)